MNDTKETETAFVLLNTSNWHQYQSYRPREFGTGTKSVFSSKQAGQKAITTMLKRLDKRLVKAETESDTFRIDQIKRDIERIKVLEVVGYNYFYDNEPMVIRKDHRTGETFTERLNTPYYLSPSSETYYST